MSPTRAENSFKRICRVRGHRGYVWTYKFRTNRSRLEIAGCPRCGLIKPIFDAEGVRVK